MLSEKKIDRKETTENLILKKETSKRKDICGKIKGQSYNKTLAGRLKKRTWRVAMSNSLIWDIQAKRQNRNIGTIISQIEMIF